MLWQTIVSLLANVLDRRLPGVVNDARHRPPIERKTRHQRRCYSPAEGCLLYPYAGGRVPG
jgi:hypothetical protein